MEVFGVHLVGLTSQNLHKLVLTVGFVAGIMLIRAIWVWVTRLIRGKSPNERVVFWTRQITSLITAILIFLAILSIWFNNPGQLATGAGLLSAGLAVALQKVITSVAGYVVIMRGKTFSVGDRITIGGVRGDVIALGFIQTRVMEMGQAPAEQSADPAMWVHARQYTGRIVSVSNDKVFDSPVYNYSREFPFIWEEMRIPITYETDREKVEKIMIDAATEVTKHLERLSKEDQLKLEQKYFIPVTEYDPKVYYRLTDNWLELTVRFITERRGVREIKDKMSRIILDRFKAEGIGIASATYDVVGFPPIRLEDRTLHTLEILATGGGEKV